MARSTRGLYKRGNVWWMTYCDAIGTQRFEFCKTSNKKDAEMRLVDRRKEAQEGLLPAAPGVLEGGAAAAGGAAVVSLPLAVPAPSLRAPTAPGAGLSGRSAAVSKLNALNGNGLPAVSCAPLTKSV